MEEKELPFLVLGDESFESINLVDERGQYTEGVYVKNAIEKAFQSNLDLVCFMHQREDSNALCKIIDFGKWRYNGNKRKVKKKEVTKEIRFSQLIEPNDISHKLKHAREFIKNGLEIIFTMRLRRRQSREKAFSKMKEILDSCSDFSSFSEIKSEGNVLSSRLTKLTKK